VTCLLVILKDCGVLHGANRLRGFCLGGNANDLLLVCILFLPFLPIPVAARLLGSWVRIPPGAWLFVSCAVFVLSGRGLCDRPIPRPDESYRLWCVSECDQVEIKPLYTCCEQVGRRGKDYETKPVIS
jgi:hypothetical protein